MNKQEFELSQQKLEKINRAVASKERKKSLKLYFEFSDSKTRNRARDFLNKTREERKNFDELFLYFEGCYVDSARPDVGIEIKFSKTIPGMREKMEALLAKNNLLPEEEYETVDGEPVPEETRINRLK